MPSLRYLAKPQLDLSRICAAASACLGHFPFEDDRTFQAASKVSISYKAVSVLEDGHFNFQSRRLGPMPDQFCFDRFEERLNSRVVLAVSFTRH